jgi:hypothetical protein
MLQKLRSKNGHAVGILASVLAFQLYSLIRNFTEAPKCGRFVEPVAHLKVLINCDSAVFMKDADNPSRLFNGDSDYQDRPAYSLVNTLLLKISRIFNLPEKIFPVKGISGEIYGYSSSVYTIFIFLNLIVLMLAVLVVIKVFSDVETAPRISSRRKLYFLYLAIGVLAANELTKTFFWTPHSQMFNLLQPALAFYLLNNLEKITTSKRFVMLNFYLVIVTFFYPSAALLASILLFAPVKNLIWRIFAITVVFTPYILYPFFINLFGGEYRNNHISKFREFIWVWDALKDGLLIQAITQNANSFALTFPIIPSTLIVIFFGIAGVMNKEFSKVNLKRALTSPFSTFIVIYVSYLYFLGFYSRRLTLGLIVFLSLTLLLYIMKKTPPKLERFVPHIAIIFGLFTFSSWFFTNGPLV